MRLRAVLLVCLATLLAAQVYKSKEEQLPRKVDPQPIPFSHKQHAAAECTDCHTTAKSKERAGLPKPDRCLLCHRGKMELPQLPAATDKIPWVRVYTVRDFVFFSHVNHTKAGLECQTCHGPVATRDVLAQEISTSMPACMNCHAKLEVSNECAFCHTLGY